MADKRCERGHLIDELWDLCPYCPAPETPVSVIHPRGTIADGDPLNRRRPEDREPVTERPDEPRQPRVHRPAEDRREPNPARPEQDHEPVLADFSSMPGFQRTVAVRKAEVAARINRYVVAWLVGLSGNLRGESFPVRIGRNVIGRDKRSDIAVNDELVSAHHADLMYRPDERRFILMDHNSTNGTYVNDEEIEPRRNLAKGDIIRVGSHRLLFVPLVTDEMYWDGEGLLK